MEMGWEGNEISLNKDLTLAKQGLPQSPQSDSFITIIYGTLSVQYSSLFNGDINKLKAIRGVFDDIEYHRRDSINLKVCPTSARLIHFSSKSLGLGPHGLLPHIVRIDRYYSVSYLKVGGD